ncbi:MAG: hypothetical protein KDH20_17645 [Rhodocyclaceae bacterium]|nr:hypothetical protein [Rhodocyclaceae bacterium]
MTPSRNPRAGARHCARCQTEFRPHEGGECPSCGRPLCRVHGGAGHLAVRCPACERAAQAAAVTAHPLPEAA